MQKRCPNGLIFAVNDPLQVRRLHSASAVSHQPGADLIAQHLRDQQQGKREGDISVYSCPDCGGALWQLGKEQQLEFCCHLGHQWTGDTLIVAKSRVLEQAIMEAVRELKEKGMLLRQLAAMLNPHSTTTAALIEQADVKSRCRQDQDG